MLRNIPQWSQKKEKKNTGLQLRPDRQICKKGLITVIIIIYVSLTHVDGSGSIKGKQQQFLFNFLPRVRPDENMTRSVIGSFHFLPSRGWDLPYCYPPSSAPAVMREYFPRVWKQIQALLFKSLLNQPNQLSLISFSRATIHSIRLLKVSVRWIFPPFCPSCGCRLRLTGGSRAGCTDLRLVQQVAGFPPQTCAEWCHATTKTTCFLRSG